MKLSGVAISQWKNLCKEYASGKKPESEIPYKISRAIELGKAIHIYKNGAVIVRYHDLNILMDGSEIMTIWRDRTIEPVNVSDSIKKMYDKAFYKPRNPHNVH